MISVAFRQIQAAAGAPAHDAACRCTVSNQSNTLVVNYLIMSESRSTAPRDFERADKLWLRRTREWPAEDVRAIVATAAHAPLYTVTSRPRSPADHYHVVARSSPMVWLLPGQTARPLVVGWWPSLR